MPDYIIVQGDTEPLFFDELVYNNEEPVDLSGATVNFVMRSLNATAPVVLAGTTTIVNPSKGEIVYVPAAADTSVVGNYMASWHVTFGGGEQQTFPTEGWLWVQVQPNLTAEGARQLVSLGEVRDRLYGQSQDHTHDYMLVEDIEAAGALIENLAGPILPKVCDEWYEGGHSTISVRHQPSYGFGSDPLFTVMAVSEYRGPIEYELSLVPTPTAGTVYSAMAHGELGTIVRRTAGGGTYAFWSDPEHPAQSIHVVYYVGQKTVPPLIKRAVTETVRWWHETTQMVGKGALSLGDMEPAERPRTALPYHVEAMLAPMKRAPVCA